MSEKKHQLRQGDLFFVEVDEDAKPSAKAKVVQHAPQYCVAMGEATGHAHILEGADVEMWEDADGTLWIGTGDDGAVVKHDEHAPVKLKPNRKYQMRRQRQAKNDREWERVRD